MKLLVRAGTFVFIIIGLLAVTPGPAVAQDPEHPLHGYIGGGPTFALGSVGDRFSSGWGPALGLSRDFNDGLAFQFEYAYRRLRLKEDFEQGLLSANHSTQQLDFNLVQRVTKKENRIRGYLVGGPGLYYRKVEITRFAGTGLICDPYLMVCAEVAGVIGSRGGWDFGVNFGGGFSFPITGDGPDFYVESRYHYVWGPEVGAANLPAGVTVPASKANGNYWPLTFGIRF